MPKLRWDGVEDLEPERILQIAISKGSFFVSYRWRDHKLLNRCNKLVKEGKLKRKRCPPGQHLFVPVVQPKQKESSDAPFSHFNF